MALSKVDPKNEKPYHISFDIDALDRHEAPSTVIPRNIKLVSKIISNEIFIKLNKISFQ